MKLAVCATSAGLTAPVDQRFGRCPYFVVVETDSEKVVESIPNQNVQAAGGAGPQSAQLLAGHDVDAVALGNVGPNAAAALEAAKIKIYSGIEGTVQDTLQLYKDGKLQPASGANVTAHHGMQDNS